MKDSEDAGLKQELRKFAKTLSGIKPTIDQLMIGKRPEGMPIEEFRFFKKQFDGYMKARKKLGEVFWNNKAQGTYVKEKI